MNAICKRTGQAIEDVHYIHETYPQRRLRLYGTVAGQLHSLDFTIGGQGFEILAPKKHAPMGERVEVR